MEERLHTSSESLSKLVRWAHSHGTICSLIPSLKHLLTEGSHGHLTAMWGCGAGHAYHWPLRTTPRSSQKETRSCYQDNREAAPQPGSEAERGFLSRSSKAKGGSSAQTRDSCDFSNCSDPSEGDDNTEEFGGNLFDMACESSATDEDRDVDYEPLSRLPRKRGGATEGGAVKRIKQEVAESYYSPTTDSDPKPCSSTRLALGHAALSHKPLSGNRLGPSPSSALSSSPHASLGLPQAPPGQQEQSQSLSELEAGRPSGSAPSEALPSLEAGHPPGSAPSEALPSLEAGRVGLGELNPDLELLVEHALNDRTDGLGDAGAGPVLGEIARLRGLLRAERSRSEALGETVSSLKQDKELLQQELTKKAELICDFLQDQLRPDKRRTHSSSQMTHPSNPMTHPSNHMTHPSNHMTHPSNQMTHPSNHMTHPSNHMEPGSSHMVPFVVEEAAFDSPALFDSFEEVELHPLDRQRGLKSKRSRDGENTRVRMKNVVGVIARYMAALQEFRRSVSMKVAFDRVGVDRNTISRTAAIAELSLAAPEVFHALAPWDEKEETLAHYAHRCRQAMDDNIKAKIKGMKAKGDLLPIVSK